LRISAEKLFDLQGVRAAYARGLRITCNGDSSGRKLQEMLQPYRAGRCPVQIVYYNKGAVCEIELGEAWRVDPQEALIESLSQWLKPENVQVVYP
jgi:DNA polymerase-3 subunit alpha